MRKYVHLMLPQALTYIIFAVALTGSARAVEVQWNFNNAGLAPVYNDHTTSMTYRNGATTSGAVQFGTASGFGLPAMPGGNAAAMKFPAFTSSQGLSLYDLGPANGGGTYVNKYTMAWDILVPDVSANYLPFYQTSLANGTDADAFIRPSDGAIGIINDYHGAVTSNAWHRIVVAVDLTVPSMAKYIDGQLVGTTALTEGLDGRWSLFTDANVVAPPDADAFILTDNDGETNAGYIHSYYYTNQVVSAGTIESWGGADFDGVKSVPEPSSFVLAAFGLPGLAAWGWRRRKRSH